MFRNLLIVLILVSSTVFGQEKARDGKENKPVLRKVSNKDVVQSIYPKAAKVEKVNDYWFRVLNGENKTIGFAMSSASFCKDIKGYNDVTPVMILTDKNWVIKKVALLSNWESVGFVRKLEKKGFFNLWVGKTLKEAKTVQVDGYTGATFTAKAVSKNVDFLLKNGSKKLPK
jgi:hypothetical protein